MKILLVLPFFYPHKGGSQKYAEELHAALMDMHPNVEVDVLAYDTDNVTRDYEKFETYRNNFNVYRIPCWHLIKGSFAIPYPFALIQKLRQLSSNKYDFVNTHIRFFDPTWWVWFYARKIDAKSIFTGHVAVHPVHKSKIVQCLAKIADLTIAKWALKKYDILTFTNKTAFDFFGKSLGVDNSANKHLIYGGVDTGFFRPATDRTNRIIPKINMSIPDSQLIITFVGRMIWSKGITFYYDAIRALKDSAVMAKAIFILAGPGTLEEEMRQKIAEDQLGNKVVMTGNLDYEEVRNLLAVSDIFINPSNHSEGFPNTILEAGASGCYVIATDNAGTWEVIENGKTGQLVQQRNPQDFVQALSWAVSHPMERKKIAENFRHKLVTEFDWNVIAEKYYQLLVKESLQEK